MDGAWLLRRVRQLLNEASDSSFMKRQLTFDYCYEAAKEFVRRTNCLTSTQEITTVADQAEYVLNADFMGCYLRDPNNDLFVKYYDTETYHFLPFRPHDAVIYYDDTDSIEVPSYFTLHDYASLYDLVSGAANADGAETGGKSVLSVAADKFGNVSVGDPVHNITQSYSGIVTEVTSEKLLDTCIFDSDSTKKGWLDTETFKIQPRGRISLILDPPPETAGHTVTVYYLQRPVPVYSDYDVYRFALDYGEAFAKYAAWHYKYRDKEPNMGDAFYLYFVNQARQYWTMVNDLLDREDKLVPKFD